MPLEGNAAMIARGRECRAAASPQICGFCVLLRPLKTTLV